MASKGPSPKPGQGGLFGPEIFQPVVDLSERRAIGAALDERHLGHVALEAFTETDLELVDPAKFEEVLFTASARSESRCVNGVAINAAEAESVPGSVNRLTHRVAERTQNSRTRRGDTNAERRKQKAEKSKVETLKGYLGNREGVLSGLEYELTELEKVKENLEHRNLNRGKGATLLPRLHYVMQFSFANMLEVMADELGWDNQTREAAKQAMRYQIIQSPDRFTYTHGLTKTAIQYAKSRHNIFRGKYAWAERELTRLERLGQGNLIESTK